MGQRGIERVVRAREGFLTLIYVYFAKNVVKLESMVSHVVVDNKKSEERIKF